MWAETVSGGTRGKYVSRILQPYRHVLPPKIILHFTHRHDVFVKHAGGEGSIDAGFVEDSGEIVRHSGAA